MSSLKHKGKGPQALTANLLEGGYSVWLTEEFTWSQDFQQALTTEDPDLMERMQAVGDRDVDTNAIVGLYFIDIEPDTGLPVRYREKFRARGPSYDTADQLQPKESA